MLITGGLAARADGVFNTDILIEDGRIDQFIKERYASFETGIGKAIVSGQATLEDLEEYTLKNGEVKTESGRQELLESIVNSVLFG